ncbi:MAG: DUF4387 domain-containing protein [Clostridia bacterium]|nr:DUF4387 domain-containing protein [Clostridia bacterium]
MTRLVDLATVVRSKNAGPLWLTLDVMFDGEENFTRAIQSEAITPKSISDLFGVPAEKVSIIPYPIVNSIKITIPRNPVSGSIGETDVYGCQQYLPLYSLMV